MFEQWIKSPVFYMIVISLTYLTVGLTLFFSGMKNYIIFAQFAYVISLGILLMITYKLTIKE